MCHIWDISCDFNIFDFIKEKWFENVKENIIILLLLFVSGYCKECI